MQRTDDLTEQSLYSFIIKTALKTVAIFLIVLAMLISVLGVLFPKLYMNIYRDLGANIKAAAFAEIAADRLYSSHSENCTGSCEYMSLISTGIGLAERSGDDRYSLEKLYSLTDKYINSPCADKHSGRIDNMAIEEYGKSDVATLSMVYGYKSYLLGERTYAACKLGKAQEEYDNLKSVLSGNGNYSADYVNVILRYSEFLNSTSQISDYIDKKLFEGIVKYYDSVKAEVAEMGLGDTVELATKSSIQLRLVLLAEEMDKTERNLLNSGELDEEFKALISEDKFSEEEIAQTCKEYIETVNTISA